MHESNFQTIFYPQDITVNGKGDRTPPQALLVPHASFDWIGDGLKETYGLVSGCEPERIILLAPLHQEVRPSLVNHWLFVPQDDGISIFGKEVHFAKDIIDSIILSHKEDIMKDDAVFQEEPDWELHAAMCAACFPTVPVVPILGCGALESKRVRFLSSLLSSILTPKTLVIATCNASQSLDAKASWSQASAFTACLENGESVLDKGHKGIIGACGYGFIEALGRIPPFNAHWDVIGLSVRNRSFSAMPPEAVDFDGDAVWHVYAIGKRS